MTRGRLLAAGLLLVGVASGAVLSEFSTAPWVELANHDSVPLVIDNWELRTNYSTAVVHCTIPAGGYLVIDSAALAAGRVVHGALRLNRGGDLITLTGANEHVLYPATPTDRTHSIAPDAGSSASFYEQGTFANWYVYYVPTPSRANDGWVTVSGQLLDAPDTIVNVTLLGAHGIARVPVAPGDSFLIRGLGAGSYRLSARAGRQGRTWFGNYYGLNDLAAGGTYAGKSIILAQSIWDSLRPMPLRGRAGKDRTVRDGGALAYHAATGGVYAVKGHRTIEFWRYTPGPDTWVQLTDVPMGEVSTGGGTAITVAGGLLYLVRGVGTRDFFCYRPSANTWERRASVPVTVGDGAGLAPGNAGGEDRVFLLRGGKTLDFFGYDPVADSWRKLTGAPAGASGKYFFAGSALAGNGGAKVYALKGRWNEFYRYDIADNRWTTEPPIPLIGRVGKKRPVGRGAALAAGSGVIYALKGGNTNEFYRFVPGAAAWEQSEDIPLGARWRRVGAGGALAVVGDSLFYALKGKGTLEFFSCRPVAEDWAPTALADAGRRIADDGLFLTPNPARNYALVRHNLGGVQPLAVVLYDVTGRPVWKSTLEHRRELRLDLTGVASGIYLLRLASGRTSAESKLVIRRE